MYPKTFTLNFAVEWGGGMFSKDLVLGPLQVNFEQIHLFPDNMVKLILTEVLNQFVVV